MFDIFHGSYFSTLIQITLLNMIALISPGPDFAVVTHNSLMYGRRIGLMTAVGITVGELIHLSYIILGFGSLISKNFWLLTAIKLIGFLYLISLGFRMLFARSKKQSSDNYKNKHVLPSYQAVLRGTLTNFLNPKAILFFISVFSIVVDVDTPIHVLVMYGFSILLTTFGWFGFVAIFFSMPSLSNKLSLIKHKIEKVTGAILILISMKIVLTHEH